MARWELVIHLDRRKGVPLYLQIARAISDDIRRGRLRPGDALPGTRTLAHTLGVQRLTVVTAFDELAAEGWIESRPARGTVVSPSLPDLPPIRTEHHGIPHKVPFDVPAAPPSEMPYDVPPGGLLLAPNRPDVRLVPAEMIGRAYRRALRRAGAQLLTYGRPQGHERLRTAVASMLSSTRGIAAKPDDICITRGSQMALALLGRALLRPGDAVAVEELTYRPAIEAFRQLGATIVPIALDHEGLRVGELSNVARLRAVYVTPHHQFPTTVTLSAPRRLELLEMAHRRRFAILEEDYDHEFHYDGAPVLPLASVDRFGVVAYAGTFSKVLAPALRMGYIVAPAPVLKAAIAHRLHIDVQGDRVLEYALAELMEEGELQRAIRRTRREYAARREVLAAALRQRLGEAMTFDMPSGGIALWVRAAEGIDIDEWAGAARRSGAVMITARQFAVNGRPRPFARLGFANLNRRELAEAVRRLEKALRMLD